MISSVEVVDDGGELVRRSSVRTDRGSSRRARAAPSRPRRARHSRRRALARRPPHSAHHARSAAAAPPRNGGRARRDRLRSPPPRLRPSERDPCRRSAGSRPLRASPRSGGSRRPSARFRRGATPSGSARSGREPACAYASIGTWPGWAATRSSHARIAGYALEVEPALVGHVRVRVQRDVRERVARRRRRTSGRPAPAPSRRARSSRPRAGAPSGARSVSGCARVGLPEPRDRDVRLVAVLLEELPLQHLCALVRVLGDVLRAVAEVPEDRVRLRERPAVVEHERRDAEAGFSSPSTSERFERSTTDSSTVSYASPRCASRRRTL